MPEHNVKRGLDIPIAGAASGEPVSLETPSTIAYSPVEFPGLVPRLAAREGDVVAKGAPLFFDKNNPDIKLLSPIAGKVIEVRRGRRRVITDLVVQAEGAEEESFPSHSLDSLKSITADVARSQLLAGGLWPYLLTRPLDRVADPAVIPQSILVGGHETGPCMPSAAALVRAEDKEALQAGIYVLKSLTSAVHLTKSPDAHAAFDGVQAATLHTFRGPHPAGDPAVQVNLVDPPRGGGQVWYLRAWQAVLIGRLFLSGKYPAERIYGAVGAGLESPRLVSTVLGAPISDIVGKTRHESVRWIRGSVLTGEAVDGARWASFYAPAIHALPDVVERELFGWALPGFGKFSAHKAFPAGMLKPKGPFDIRPGLFGGERAMVPVGFYGDVVPTPDILPEFLFKSIIVGDLAESISLGLLDITAEEAALCTYICPSKIEFDVLLREGLELYIREA
jgi:Na+-transporting NADH:ubiquinone oxidoreductase subunit A